MFILGTRASPVRILHGRIRQSRSRRVDFATKLCTDRFHSVCHGFSSPWLSAFVAPNFKIGIYTRCLWLDPLRFNLQPVSSGNVPTGIIAFSAVFLTARLHVGGIRFRRSGISTFSPSVGTRRSGYVIAGHGTIRFIFVSFGYCQSWCISVLAKIGSNRILRICI